MEITDDEEDGVIGANILSSIYKGSYYQAILSTDDHYNFFADTDYEWLKGDRVGIKIAPEKILIEKRDEELKQEERVVIDETVDGFEEIANLESEDNAAGALNIDAAITENAKEEGEE